MPLSETPLAQAFREFESRTCAACGNLKRERQSFCFNCFKKLPADMQAGLYARFGDGYTENYQEAKDWLLQERKANA